MKRFKKVLGLVIAGCMTLSTLMISAGAVGASTESDVSRIAHMDVATAPASMVDSILEARAKIIYGDQAWTVNGAVKKINADGTVEALPEFSDLFPSWDLPTIHTTCATTTSVQGSTTNSSIGYKGNVELKVCSSCENSPAFYSFNGLGTDVKAYAKTLPGDRYNLGFTNEDTRKDVGWVANIAVGSDSGYTITADNNVRYSVRASVFDEDDVGWAYMIVKDLG